MNIPTPQPEGEDIYSLGFDAGLERDLPEIQSNVVYDSIADQTPAQVVTLGGIMAGAANTFVAIDPTKGLWLGNATFENAPFRVNMDGEVVATSGNFSGQFTIGGTTVTIDNTKSIQTSVDAVAAAGGGTVYLQNGTYTLTADLVIPSGVTLQGVSRDGVIIDCNTLYKVSLTGANVYTTGTASVTSGGTAVTGVGTTWTSAMIGRSIFLDSGWYQISAVGSNTTLTLLDSYSGNSLSGYAYAIADPISTVYLRSFTITNATGIGLNVTYANIVTVDSVEIYGCGTGIYMNYVFAPQIINGDCYSNGINGDFNYVSAFEIIYLSFAFSTSGVGLSFVHCSSSTFFDSDASGNTTNGMSLTSCNNIAFISMSVNANGAKGIELISNNSYINFIAMELGSNTSDGIKLTATSDSNTLVAMDIHDNGGYGVNVAASTCDNNIINSPAFSTNSSGNINDSGTNTTVLPLAVDIQTFDASGTWTKPAGAKSVVIQAWGGGGAGGSVSSSGSSSDAGGGGGGEYTTSTVNASGLSSTIAITVPAAATAGNAGGNVTFGSYLTAYGGGAGATCGNTQSSGGGGGGGISAAGASSVANAGAQAGGAGGGLVGSAAGTDNGAFGGAGGGSNAGGTAGNAVYGGAGGGGGKAGAGNGSDGGTSVYGGGGGGGGSENSSSAGGTSMYGGAGGAGGGATNGTNGTAPGGGGGGCGRSSSGTFTGGNGAAGRIRVITYP